MRDDGAVVYLNGTEVFRTQHADRHDCLQHARQRSAIEETTDTTSINPALLQAGSNVLAVEIHQANGTSTDISFNARARRIDVTLQLTRGPYLQIGTPSSVVVRWRTNAPSNSHVPYGPSPASLI